MEAQSDLSLHKLKLVLQNYRVPQFHKACVLCQAHLHRSVSMTSDITRAKKASTVRGNKRAEMPPMCGSAASQIEMHLGS
jgi:hypothetical protein